MIVSKEKMPGEGNTWMVQLDTGETIKVACREGQTPEEVLEEAEPE